MSEYTAKWDCGHTLMMSYADVSSLTSTTSTRDSAGRFLISGPCRACRQRIQARGIFYKIDYDTSAPGADGTPVDGWYPSESREVPGDSDRLVDGPDGDPDLHATAMKLIARWLRIFPEGAKRGRFRFQGWTSGQVSMSDPAAIEIIDVFP
jgi:hypothetical protein